MKKIICLVLVLTVVMTMGLPSFASNLKITEPVLNTTSYYQGDGGSNTIYENGNIWTINQRLGSYSHTFTDLELLNLNIIEQTILFGLGSISGGSAYLLGVAKAIHQYKIVDVEDIGGVYTKSYYCKRLLNPSHINSTVPVPHQFAFITVFYNSPYMTSSNIAYIRVQNDGGPRLDTP